MPVSASAQRSGNDLLDRIPPAEFSVLAPHLKSITLSLRQVLHNPDEAVEHIYFPTTALISLMTVMQEEDPVEGGTVGREGFVGVAATLGVIASPGRALCQLPGNAWQMPVARFLEALGRSPELTSSVHRYLVYTLRFAWQSVACNALHPIEARAGRWLLLLHDQAGGDAFPITQEFLAIMLGVRRQGVSAVASILQRAGLIRYSRGKLTVLDRHRLEQVACECYATMRAYHNGLNR